MKKHERDIYSDYGNNKMPRKKINFFKKFQNNEKFNGFLKFFGKIFVCIILIFIIMFSILICALTVYAMKLGEKETEFNLEKSSIIGSEHTTVYGKNSDGKPVKLSVIDSGIKRIWIDISDVPKQFKDAVVAIEDHNFYKHDGVDFRRTAGAVLNMFLHFWRTNQGGSTITQQLLKNITGEKDVHGLKGISRKVKEISRAISLERKYSKDQILQAYLNIVYVGHGNCVGMQTASKLYFNKSLKKVNLQEAAALAALIRNPGRYDMLKDPNKILNRRNHVLNRMYETGKLTKKECEQAKKTRVIPRQGDIYKDKKENYQSYFVDTALNEVVLKYKKEKNIKNWDDANEKVKKSGLRIYTTIDADMQQRLEKEYEDNLKFSKNVQSAFVIFDLNGNMKACVGRLGKKPLGDRSSINYATSSNSLVLPGSTMKAFVYAYAVEKDMLTYSSLFKDAPFKKVEGKPWPENYGNKHSNSLVSVSYAVKRSLNTVPTKILYDSGQNGVADFCDFLTKKLKISNIVSPRSENHNGKFETSAMAMGSLTKGIILSEFTNAFSIFANGGSLKKGTTLEKVLNQSGEDVLNLNKKRITAISQDTSVVLNRLLRNVVLNGGTGAAANLDFVEVVGKTGTSNDGRNLLFIGATPKYVAGIWFGSTNGSKISENSISSSRVWGNIMRKILPKTGPKKFSVAAAKEQIYCEDSGLIANSSCPKKEKGFYKRDNFLTKHCTLHG